MEVVEVNKCEGYYIDGSTLRLHLSFSDEVKGEGGKGGGSACGLDANRMYTKDVFIEI